MTTGVGALLLGRDAGARSRAGQRHRLRPSVSRGGPEVRTAEAKADLLDRQTQRLGGNCVIEVYVPEPCRSSTLMPLGSSRMRALDGLWHRLLCRRFADLRDPHRRGGILVCSSQGSPHVDQRAMENTTRPLRRPGVKLGEYW
jgi:hypothetical protein